VRAYSLRRSLTQLRYAASERIDTAAAGDGVAVNEPVLRPMTTESFGIEAG